MPFLSSLSGLMRVIPKGLESLLFRLVKLLSPIAACGSHVPYNGYRFTRRAGPPLKFGVATHQKSRSALTQS